MEQRAMQFTDPPGQRSSASLRYPRILLSLLLLVEILLIPSAILIFDLHPSLTLILVLEYAMTLACFTSAAETKLKQLNFSIQMKLSAIILSHACAIIYLCYITPHDTLKIFIERIQARVIHINTLDLIVYTIYFAIKVVTVATVSRSVSSLLNRSKEISHKIHKDEKQHSEIVPEMYLIEQPQLQQQTAVWQVMMPQQPMIVQYVYSNTADMNWM
jgi:hypothetical protein